MKMRLVFFLAVSTATMSVAVAQDDWKQLMTANDLREVLQTESGALLVGTYTDGFYRSTDDGITFSKVYTIPAPESFISFQPTASGAIFACGSADVLRSDDDGATWSRCRVFDGKNGGCIRLTGDGHTLYLSSQRGFYRSADGVVWERVSDRRFYSLVSRPDGVLLAHDSLTLDMLRSTDGGSSWNTVGHVDRRWSRMFSGDNGVVYITGNPSYRSLDAGEHWDAMTDGIPEHLGPEAMTVHRDGPVFIMAYFMAYRSLDDGATWTAVRPIFNFDFLGPFYADRQGRLYASDGGRLLRTEPIPTAVSTVPNAEDFTCTVSPNPSGGNTTLSLSFPRAASVRVTITDALGRVAVGETTHECDAGACLLPLRTAALAPGMYYVSISGRDFRNVQQMVLTR